MSATYADEDDDDKPTLSADTLAALQNFYRDKDDREKQFEDLKSSAEADFAEKEWSIDAFAEDWNASQFWYNDETAMTLAKELLEDATKESCIAVVSVPSVYIQLKKILSTIPISDRPELRLLEFDERFSVFKPDFVPYDFTFPLKLPPELKGRFDRVICDPPFLSTDCQTKAALTVRWLSKSWQKQKTTTPTSTSTSTQQGQQQQHQQRVISCTGERMSELVLKLYDKVGLRTTDFAPVHTKGLSNEFRCHANFEGAAWRFVAA